MMYFIFSNTPCQGLLSELLYSLTLLIIPQKSIYL